MFGWFRNARRKAQMKNEFVDIVAQLREDDEFYSRVSDFRTGHRTAVTVLPGSTIQPRDHETQRASGPRNAKMSKAAVRANVDRQGNNGGNVHALKQKWTALTSRCQARYESRLFGQVEANENRHH